MGTHVPWRPQGILGVAVAVAASLLVACVPQAGPTPEPATDPLLSNSIILAASTQTSPASGRQPTFPEDDGPHANLTEWWYYTGHLNGDQGERYGFEFVIFQSTLGGLNLGYVAHFAVTDLQRNTFSYGERIDIVMTPHVAASTELTVADWTLAGLGDNGSISAEIPGYQLEIRLDSQKPPVLHGKNGIIDLGPGGLSYYYSRTRMALTGRLTDHGKEVTVSGLAWMDHQWGDFIAAGGGGWDWFSAQLDDGTELTVTEIRGPDGLVAVRYGTYVGKLGELVRLKADEIAIDAVASWTSPASGATYPSGWRIDVASLGLELEVRPLLLDQELITHRSTGVVYWEGAVAISGEKMGEMVEGLGYVELTGYAGGRAGSARTGSS